MEAYPIGYDWEIHGSMGKKARGESGNGPEEGDETARHGILQVQGATWSIRKERSKLWGKVRSRESACG
jgi:hypothetical protein